MLELSGTQLGAGPTQRLLLSERTCSQLSGFIVQWVDDCPGIGEVMSLNPVETTLGFQLSIRDNKILLNFVQVSARITSPFCL